MTDDATMVGEAGFDALLDLLDTVADRVGTLDVLAGEGIDAQENRAIRLSRARLARAEARRALSAVDEVQDRTRTLARAVDVALGRSARPTPMPTPAADGDALAVTRAVDDAARSSTRTTDPSQRLVEGARLAAPGVCWAQLALDRGGHATRSAGHLPEPAVVALEAGPRAAVLAGADAVLAVEGDERWSTALTGGVRSALALPAGRGVLLLASPEVATFDDGARLVAGLVAERAARIGAGEDRPRREATDREVLDGARAVLARRLGIGHDATVEVLLEVARTLGRPVLATAHLVLAALVPADRPAGPAAGPEPAVLRRARAYIDAHALDDITTADIAEAAGLGARGVQLLFRRHDGLTPTQYLRQVRLGRAHAELCDADAASGLTVAAVAARWHFGHPGRFSIAYRQRFGVSPSRTLRA